jgi:hypothetical protein
LSKENDVFLNNIIPTNTQKTNISGKIDTKRVFSLLKQKQKQSFTKATTLSLDSIFDMWNGSINVTWGKFIQKTDTIVTYTYDEDFNKVEKKEVQKRVIPNFNVEIGGKKLYHYLQKKKAIKKENTQPVLVLNPLFKTYTQKTNKGIRLYSKFLKNKEKQNRTTSKEGKFTASIFVKDILPFLPTSLWGKKEILEHIKQIDLVIKEDATLSARIIFLETSDMEKQIFSFAR